MVHDRGTANAIFLKDLEDLNAFDICALKIQSVPRDLKPIPLASDLSKIGTKLIHIGWGGTTSYLRLKNSTYFANKYNYSDSFVRSIQSDGSESQPGDSGGPALVKDDNGNV